MLASCIHRFNDCSSVLHRTELQTPLFSTGSLRWPLLFMQHRFTVQVRKVISGPTETVAVNSTVTSLEGGGTEEDRGEDGGVTTLPTANHWKKTLTILIISRLYLGTRFLVQLVVCCGVFFSTLSTVLIHCRDTNTNSLWKACVKEQCISYQVIVWRFYWLRCILPLFYLRFHVLLCFTCFCAWNYSRSCGEVQLLLMSSRDEMSWPEWSVLCWELVTSNYWMDEWNDPRKTGSRREKILLSSPPTHPLY